MELVSDNGPPYNSEEFDNFAREYEFELRKSSPTYPQSNGRVENAIKTAKQLIKKAIISDNDFYLTWHSGTGETHLQRVWRVPQHNDYWADEHEHRCQQRHASSSPSLPRRFARKLRG